MNEYIRKALEQMPALRVTDDGELAREIAAGLEIKGGHCPCFSKKVKCPCASAQAVVITEGGEVPQCHCGLFVYGGENG